MFVGDKMNWSSGNHWVFMSLEEVNLVAGPPSSIRKPYQQLQSR